MRIYLDTSAAAKLFLAERETLDLRLWLTNQSEPITLVSSALLNVELRRLLGFVSPDMVAIAESFLASDVDLVEILPSLLEEAARVPPARLRTLDAIHLATALDLSDTLDFVLTYDKLLIEAAQFVGLKTATPGIVE